MWKTTNKKLINWILGGIKRQPSCQLTVSCGVKIRDSNDKKSKVICFVRCGCSELMCNFMVVEFENRKDSVIMFH
jgi:hypothetical protein